MARWSTREVRLQIRRKRMDFSMAGSSTFQHQNVLVWRLAWQSIPFGDVLHHRKMAASSSCAICGMEDSWRHSLLECNLAKCVWALEKEDITEFIGCLQEQDARAWLAQTFSSLPQEDLVRVTTCGQSGMQEERQFTRVFFKVLYLQTILWNALLAIST